jgi:hypothetical protein
MGLKNVVRSRQASRKFAQLIGSQSGGGAALGCSFSVKESL